MIQSFHLTSAGLRQAMRIAALVLTGAAALLIGSNVAAQSTARTACDRVPPSQGSGPQAPDLTGISAEQAIRRLRAAQMSPQTIEIPSDAPPGRVVDQWPKRGQRVVDGTVILCVSRGAPDAAIAMPDLFHQTEAAARLTLRRARIRNVPTIRNAEHAEARGVVFDQVPRATRPVTATTRIILHVSSGPPPTPAAIPMPALRGLSLEQAVQALTNARIPNSPEITRVAHAEPPDQVFDQSPEAATPVDAATPITLQVSSGPVPPLSPIPMPALVGLTLDQARQALDDLRIANRQTVAYADNSMARGLVYDQSPEPRAPLGADDAIVIQVSNGPATGATAPVPVEVPLLAGLGEGEARALLERTGLVGVLDGSEESFLAAGQVVRSSPDAGQRVPRGSAVRYVLSLGPPPEPRGGFLRWLEDNPLLAALIALAILAAAIVAKLLWPRRPGLSVRLAGPPRGKVDWGEPPDLTFGVRVDPPRARMRRPAADRDEEGI